MNLLKIFSLLVLFAGPSLAAVSILIQPGQNNGTTIFTVTQTSPSPILSVSGLSGYASGMSLPNSMFNIPGFDSGFSSDVFGSLSNSLATITEAFSGQSFLLNQLRVSADSSAPSLLGFDRLFTLPTGAPTIRFDVNSPGSVEINIAYEALVPGVHSINDTLFDAVTVTVIPESSTFAYMVAAVIPFFSRKRGFRQGSDLSQMNQRR